jgi:hypothetical protein
MGPAAANIEWVAIGTIDDEADAAVARQTTCDFGREPHRSLDMARAIGGLVGEHRGVDVHDDLGAGRGTGAEGAERVGPTLLDVIGARSLRRRGQRCDGSDEAGTVVGGQPCLDHQGAVVVPPTPQVPPPRAVVALRERLRSPVEPTDDLQLGRGGVQGVGDEVGLRGRFGDAGEYANFGVGQLAAGEGSMHQPSRCQAAGDPNMLVRSTQGDATSP